MSRKANPKPTPENAPSPSTPTPSASSTPTKPSATPSKPLCGNAWLDDTGLLFTEPDGTPLHPAKVTDLFKALTADAELPPIRLHDLRHGAATLALAAGIDIKIVQDMLGHSCQAITADTYTSVLPELAHHAAQAIATLVPPQHHHLTQGLAAKWLIGS